MLGPKLQRQVFAGLASLLLSTLFVGTTIMPTDTIFGGDQVETSIHA